MTNSTGRNVFAHYIASINLFQRCVESVIGESIFTDREIYLFNSLQISLKKDFHTLINCVEISILYSSDIRAKGYVKRIKILIVLYLN